MNKSNPFHLAATISVLSGAYAFLFYHAEMGLNVLLFDVLLLGLVLIARPELKQNGGFLRSAVGLVFAAGCVVIVNGSASKIAHHLTYFLVAGHAQSRELRFVWFALLLGATELTRGPLRWVRSRDWPAWQKVAWPYTKRLVVPSVIVIPFLSIYLRGNQVFSDATADFFEQVIYLFWVDVAVLWWLFLALFAALYVVGFFVPPRETSRFTEWQLHFRNRLERRRSRLKGKFKLRTHKTFGLRAEYHQAVIVFASLNALLGLVNLTDLVAVWGGRETLSASTLSHYVHVGTYNLSFSILLAMGVVLYYFRGNLNFLADNRQLQLLAKAWLAQNALLALSVGVRNWRYVDAYGLAYGRIYVGFGLLLILFGIHSLYRKITGKLSFSYVFQANGLVLWFTLLLFASMNWPGLITRYNLAAAQRPASVDTYYLYSILDDRNAFLIPEKMNGARYPAYTDWRSWNYADWRNRRASQRRFTPR